MENFSEYSYKIYGKKNGTAGSYIRAIQILDYIFSQYDVLHLNGKSLTSITDASEIYSIYEFVKCEEKKMRANEDSIFKYGKENQTSYPLDRFCSAAVGFLYKYRISIVENEATILTKKAHDKNDLIRALNRIASISNTEVDTEVYQRIGQSAFRCVLIEIYNCQCCVCGLNIKDLLRASHILPWTENKKNRLNPENGLCLSATYDAAFDRNLISFDEDYRMVVSTQIKEYYSNEATKDYFHKYEGKKLILPYKFYPNKEFLQKHIEKLIV